MLQLATPTTTIEILWYPLYINTVYFLLLACDIGYSIAVLIYQPLVIWRSFMFSNPGYKLSPKDIEELRMYVDEVTARSTLHQLFRSSRQPGKHVCSFVGNCKQLLFSYKYVDKATILGRIGT